MTPSDALTRMFAQRTAIGPTVRPELGACLDFTGGLDTNGYGQLWDGTANRGAHRVALEHYLGRPLHDGMFACHRCDRPSCVRQSHLYEGSHQQNVQDALTRGRHTCLQPSVWRRISETHIATGSQRGVRNPGSKLNDVAVRVIRYMAGRGVTHARLARAHNVCVTTISLIVDRRTWQHVSDDTAVAA